MNTRLHQEAFPGEDISDRPAAGDERPRPARADRGRAARAAATRRGSWSRRDRASTSHLPARLEAAAPPPVRDEVRLMVAQAGRPLVHTDFLDLPNHLRAGDLLIVNASATIPAALPARRADGTRRRPAPLDARPGPTPAAGSSSCAATAAACARRGAETLTLPGGATARAARALPLARPPVGRAARPPHRRCTPTCDAHGAPIRYAHEPEPRPLEDHQTIFATEPGSAEMPSAGRPFTKRALTRPARARRPRPADRRCTPASARRSAASARTPSATSVSRAHRAPHQRTAPRPRDRGRHDRRARARDRRRRARQRPRRARLDEPRRHARARRARRRRPADRLARARREPPADARGHRRPRRCSSAPTPPRSSAATAGTSSAICTCCCAAP